MTEKTTNIGIRMTLAEKRNLEKRAKKLGLNTSALVRLLLKNAQINVMLTKTKKKHIP